jgi:hypothetical protein
LATPSDLGEGRAKASNSVKGEKPLFLSGQKAIELDRRREAMTIDACQDGEVESVGAREYIARKVESQ